MDLSSIQQQLLTQLSSSSGTRPLLDLKQFPAGTTLPAKIEMVQRVSPEVQLRINEVLSKNLTQDSQAAEKKTQDLKVPSNFPTFNKNQLFAVRLNILGKQLLSFTDQSLSVKQNISVTVRNDGQLQLLSTAKSAGLQEPSKTTQHINNMSPRQQSVEQISAQALRQYLPRQEKLSETFVVLEKIFKTHNKLLQSTNKSPLVDLAKIIKPVLKNTHDINQVMDGKQLKPIIEKSGAFLESRISNTASTEKPITSVKPQLTQGQSPRQQETIEHDVKADILRALNIIPKSSVNSPRPENNQGTLDKLLLQILSPMGKNNAELKNAEQTLNSALKARLETALSSSLARISTLQVQHLLQKQNDPSATRFGGMFELPIRLGETIYPLTLNIQERIYEEKEEKDSSKEKKKREKNIKKMWQVFMEFDLDELGSFASEITLKDEHLSSKFWIQKNALWQESKNHLDDLKTDLENAGVFVEELQCHQGNAPAKEMKVSHALVDIKT